MTRITSVDQALLLLRAHLQRTERPPRASGGPAAPAARRSALQRAREIAARGEASEDDLHRALIAGILLDELGGAIEDDARFQEIVTKVKEAIVADEGGRRALSKALSQLSSAGPR